MELVIITKDITIYQKVNGLNYEEVEDTIFEYNGRIYISIENLFYKEALKSFNTIKMEKRYDNMTVKYNYYQNGDILIVPTILKDNDGVEIFDITLKIKDLEVSIYIDYLPFDENHLLDYFDVKVIKNNNQ